MNVRMKMGRSFIGDTLWVQVEIVAEEKEESGKKGVVQVLLLMNYFFCGALLLSLGKVLGLLDNSLLEGLGKDGSPVGAFREHGCG